LQMTVLGMGLVFALLALLWGLLTLVLRFDKTPAPVVVEADGEPVTTLEAAGAPALAVAAHAQVQGMDAALVAAITVATLAHRAGRRRAAAPETRSYWPGSLLYASRWVGAGRARQNQSWRRGGR
jgi:Na+-transporting methylmalonyl-CoA/oxaloacetate decarboxylase gamma subunit